LNPIARAIIADVTLTPNASHFLDESFQQIVVVGFIKASIVLAFFSVHQPSAISHQPPPPEQRTSLCVNTIAIN